MSKEQGAKRGPGFRVKMAFGVGAISSGIVQQAITALALLFYNQVVGMSPAAVGLALMISLIFDAFWDPAIGLWSDSLRSRFGRRHPFMYASIIPATIAFWMLWTPPSGLSDAGKFAYLLSTLMAARFFISLFEVPSTSLIPEIAPDYDARTSLVAFRYFWGIMGGVLASILAFQVYLSDRVGGITHAAGYDGFAMACAIVVFVTLLISTLGTPRPANPHSANEEGFTLRETIRIVVAAAKNRNFAAIMIAALFSGVAGGVSAGLGTYFNIYFWGLSTDAMSALLLPGLFATIVGVSFAPVASRKWGKKRVVMWLFGLSMVASMLPMGMRLSGLIPGNDWPLLLPLLAVDVFVAGSLGLMGMIVVTSMLADVVEDHAVQTGARSEGLFFAANSVLAKSVGGLGTFIAGLMLTAVNFPEKATPGSVNVDILHNLAWMYLPSSLVLSIISLYCLSFFRIDKAQHEANLAKLQSVALAQDPLLVEQAEVIPSEHPAGPAGAGPRPVT